VARGVKRQPIALLLAGPPQRTTILPRTYEVTVRAAPGSIRRIVRARRPEDALALVQAEFAYAHRVDVTTMPATVRRLDTGETWEKPVTPSPA
jgi:hypothetical protein